MSDLGNKKIMANNIKRFMAINNKTRSDICNDLNIAYTTFSDWVNGKKYPRIDKIELLANYFGIEKSDLVENKEVIDEEIYAKSRISFIEVPLYGDISCGKGSFVDDNIIDYIAVPDDNLSSNKEYFAQYAKGDSMINAGIDDGDVIVFEKTNVLDDNKIGCFCIDEGIATCKKFKKGPSYIQLIPMNPKYDPRVIDLENENFRIVGKLRKVIKSFE